MTTPQRAIIYARFSTLEQGKGGSLERQLRNGRKFAQDKGWQVEREITDLGRSAYHGSNRAEGSELYEFEAEARSGRHEGKVILVENIDRLSRQGIKRAANLIWSLNDCGVDVATFHDGHIYKAKSDSDLLDILYIATKAQRAFEESETKSNRGKDAWGEKYRKIGEKKPGVRSGRPPQWLVWDGQRYQSDPYRAKLVNEIFDLYLAGHGTYKIVQILNEREEPVWPSTNKGGGWYLAYVHKILKNRALLGEYVTLKGEVIATDYYPRVVSIEKFTAVQQIAQGRAKKGGRDFRRFNNLLSGLPLCAKCDGTAAYENKGSNSTSKYISASGEEIRYPRKLYERLRCDGYRRRKGCDNKALIDYKVVEDAVLNQLLSLTMEDDNRSHDVQKLDESIASVVRELEVANQRLNNLIDAIADGGSRSLTSRIGELEAQVESLQDQHKHLIRQREAEASKPSIADDAALIASKRADLSSPDQDVRLAARQSVNSSLLRIVDAIYIEEGNTFTILSDIAVWQFDHTGKRIGGQAL